MAQLQLTQDQIDCVQSVVAKTLELDKAKVNPIVIDDVDVFKCSRVAVMHLKKHNLVIKFMTSLNVGYGTGLKSRWGNDIILQRASNAKACLDICYQFNLYLLHIPKFTVAKYADRAIIIEEYIDTVTEEFKQHEYFKLYQSSVANALRQLHIFITKTKYSDVCARNNPIMNIAADYTGDRRIALLDLESLDNDVFNGLHYGGSNRCGLIGLIFDEKLLHELYDSDEYADTVIPERIAEIQDYNDCMQFYDDKKIVVGDEPIDESIVDTLSNIDLDEVGTYLKWHPKTDTETKESMTMREAIIGVIRAINLQLTTEESRQSHSRRRKRFMCLDINHPSVSLVYYIDIVGYDGKAFGSMKYKWMPRILNKLVEAKIIFKSLYDNGHGYFIQA